MCFVSIASDTWSLHPLDKSHTKMFTMDVHILSNKCWASKIYYIGHPKLFILVVN